MNYGPGQLQQSTQWLLLDYDHGSADYQLWLFQI